MSLQGDFHTFSVPDLFSIIVQMKRSGVLTIVSRDQGERIFIFRNGDLVSATTQDESMRLGSYLVQLGYISEEELEDIFEGTGRDGVFGRQVIERGHISEEQLARAVRRQVTDILEGTIGWDTAAFYFDDAEPHVAQEKHKLCGRSLVLDVVRRRDERASKPLETSMDLQLVFGRDEERPEGLTEVQRRVFDALDGKKSVERIIVDTGFSPEAVIARIRELGNVGLVSERAVRQVRQLENAAPDLRDVPIATDAASDIFAMFHGAVSDETDEIRVEQLLSSEPILTAKILRQLTLRNIDVARSSLSVEELREIFGSFYLRCLFVTEAVRGFYFSKTDAQWRDLWMHSQQSARLCRRLSETVGYPYPTEAFLAGLLHNLGAFMLFHQSPTTYIRAASRSFHERRDVEELEKEIFGVTHTELGGEYGERWEFPPTIVSAIRCHHDLDGELQSPLNYLLAIVDAILQTRGARVGYCAKAERNLDEALRRLDITRDDVEAAFRDVRRESYVQSASAGRTRPVGDSVPAGL